MALQQQQRFPIWLWLVLIIFILALLLSLLFITGRIKDTVILDAPTDTPVFPTDHTTVSDDWNSVIFTVPKTSYNEVTDEEIQVRSNNEYVIYSIEEPTVFDADKSIIKSQAMPKLKQIAESASKRFKGKDIRIYVSTDSVNSPISNRQLAEERANFLRYWMISNGNIDSNLISVHSVKDVPQSIPDKTSGEKKQTKQIKIVIRKSKD